MTTDDMHLWQESRQAFRGLHRHRVRDAGIHDDLATSRSPPRAV
jgi:hypothetical protein